MIFKRFFQPLLVKLVTQQVRPWKFWLKSMRRKAELMSFDWKCSILCFVGKMCTPDLPTEHICLKMYGLTFVSINICHRIASLPKLYSVTLTYLLKVKGLKRKYHWNGTTIMSLVGFNICHRLVALQKLYSLTLTYFLKVKNLTH